MRTTVITIPIGGSNKSPYVPKVSFQSIFFCLCYCSARCVCFFRLFTFSFNFKSFCEFLAHQDLCFWNQVSPLMPFLMEGHLQMDKLPLFSPPHQASPFSILSLTPLPFSSNFKSNFDSIVLGKLLGKVLELQVEVEIWMHLFYRLLCVLVLSFLCKHI